MAMGKLLSQRLFNISKMSSQSLMNCRISSSSLAVRNRVPNDPGEATVDPKPGDVSVSRRFLQNITVNWMDTTLKKPVGESLIDKLREMDVNKGRIRLDGLSPPMKPAAEEETVALGLTVQDAKKLLRAAQIEVVKTKLMETGQSWIPYSDFVSVCNDSCSDPAHGSWIGKMLDDSGNVIVLGDYVCLRPDQTALFMRLTFWELTWDVMEPICFYVTSIYFMAGYFFSCRTSKEPSFEGFYQSSSCFQDSWNYTELIFDEGHIVTYRDVIGLSTPAPHVQAQPSVKPTSAFTTTRQNPATETKGVKAQNRGK
ncbi:hypothetical protein F2Q69_00057962 [Brassica cretica]|uniref:Calcium uniporter protein C-terminal domain-containing protein n=1 Tax=Brassica cretica TaxID=69181 RepID=A0A8S9N4Z8_BRACR|nr:hypothetical protein F2Q69_00057962 [Brassica cretica]